jgi:hypothetical protein
MGRRAQGRGERGAFHDWKGRLVTQKVAGRGEVTEKREFKAPSAEKGDGLGPLGIVSWDEMDAAEFAVVACSRGAYHEIGWRGETDVVSELRESREDRGLKEVDGRCRGVVARVVR